MTEAEWLNTTDPIPLLEYLDRQEGDRKVMLLCLACCHRIWSLIPQPEIRRGIEVAEQLLEGDASKEELDAVAWKAEGALYGGVEYYADRPDAIIPVPIATWMDNIRAMSAEKLSSLGCAAEASSPASLLTLLKDAGYFADHVITMIGYEPHSSEFLKLHYRRFLDSDLIREIFGNPFCNVTIPPSILHWQNCLIKQLARSIYKQQAFDQMPILADLLVESGCNCHYIESHLRSSQIHVRGCWALDLILCEDGNRLESRGGAVD
jgi:hypothetical protein